MVVHTFLWVIPGHCLRAGFMERRNFFVLHPIRVKFHIRTRLIESFPTVYGLWSCIEIEMSIPLGAHARALSAVTFLSCPVLLKIAYSNSANRQLSIDVRPIELR